MCHGRSYSGGVNIWYNAVSEVHRLLGTTHNIVAPTEAAFIRETQRLIRRTGHAQYKPWPLINSMIIKCNSQVLADGTILVDLPGSFDVSATVLHATAAFKNKLQFTLAATSITRPENDLTLSGKRSTASWRIGCRMTDMAFRSHGRRSCSSTTHA